MGECGDAATGSGRDRRVSAPAKVDWMLDPQQIEAEYADEVALAERVRVFQDLFEGDDPDVVAQDRLRALGPRRLLDAGCGLGQLGAWAAAELGADVTGVDLSPRMVEVAAARGLRAVQADLRALPFGDSTFDCVLADSVLYHFSEPEVPIAEVARVLEPGGWLVAVCGSNDDGDRRAAWEWLFGEPVPQQPPVPFSRETGDQLLAPYFRQVERIDCDGALVFTERERLVRYVESLPLGRGAGPDVPSLENPFRLPIAGSVFVARR